MRPGLLTGVLALTTCARPLRLLTRAPGRPCAPAPRLPGLEPRALMRPELLTGVLRARPLLFWRAGPPRLRNHPRPALPPAFGGPVRRAYSPTLPASPARRFLACPAWDLER